MRLAEPAAVFKYERLKPPYVGVTVNPVILPFFCFFRFNGYRRQKSTTELTHPIRLAHFTLFARPSLKMRLASLGAVRTSTRKNSSTTIATATLATLVATPENV